MLVLLVPWYGTLVQRGELLGNEACYNQQRKPLTQPPSRRAVIVLVQIIPSVPREVDQTDFAKLAPS